MLDADLAALAARDRRVRGAERPAQGPADPARLHDAPPGGRRDPAQRDRLRRLRPVRVRLPARGEAVGHPGPPRGGVAARDADRPGRAGRTGAPRAAAAPWAWRPRSRSTACRAGSSSGRRRSSSPPARCGRRSCSSDRGSTTRRPDATSGSTPSACIGAFLDEDVAMWRGTMQAARALHHLDLDGDGTGDGAGDAPSGFIVESAPGHAGADRARVPVGGPRRVRGADGPDPPRRPDHRHRPRARVGLDPPVAGRAAADRLHAVGAGPPDARGDARRGGADRVGGRLAGDGRRRDAAALVPGRPRRRRAGVRLVAGVAPLVPVPAEPRDGRLGAPDGLGAGRRRSRPAHGGPGGPDPAARRAGRAATARSRACTWATRPRSRARWA